MPDLGTIGTVTAPGLPTSVQSTTSQAAFVQQRAKLKEPGERASISGAHRDSLQPERGGGVTMSP